MIFFSDGFLAQFGDCDYEYLGVWSSQGCGLLPADWMDLPMQNHHFTISNLAGDIGSITRPQDFAVIFMEDYETFLSLPAEVVSLYIINKLCL